MVLKNKPVTYLLMPDLTLRYASDSDEHGVPFLNHGVDTSPGHSQWSPTRLLVLTLAALGVVSIVEVFPG